MKILGIDPGLTGGFILLENKTMVFAPMPLKNKEVFYFDVCELITSFAPEHIILERAMPLAMGARHAFNYGRGFAALEIAISISGLPVTYVEPQKWTKTMHEGISSDLKPKAKSLIAVERLFPQFLGMIPKSKTGKLHEGAVDALLIAAWGQRQLQLAEPKQMTKDDF